MAKLTKAQVRRLCMEIDAKAAKVERWGRTEGRLKHGITPAFYTKMLRIGEDAIFCAEKIR
jgi:hypothetical protein